MQRRLFVKLVGGAFAVPTAFKFGTWLAAASDLRQQSGLRIWPSKPPEDCPFAPSSAIKGIGFTGRHAFYTSADTWYPSWASDDNLYSPFADGQVGNVKVSAFNPKLDPTYESTTGYARISGSDPLNLQVTALGIQKSSPWPYRGRFPAANLVLNGIWYYGTYCLDQKDPHLDVDVLGPFVGFRVSKDYGKSWTETACTPANPLFPESGQHGAKVKMGTPHFVDFGKNMQHSPDGKAYLIAHGAVRPDAQLSWSGGDQIYLARIAPTPENVNDLSKYEFFAGRDSSGQPKWSVKFSDIAPLLEWNDRSGCVTMTYNAPLRKYLMCVLDGFPTMAQMNTYVLEADEITGPWRLVTFMARFGEQGYFVNIPSKFISHDGRSAWLCYSANFWYPEVTHLKPDPPGRGCGLTLQEIRLL
jgi:hypothetical protein